MSLENAWLALAKLAIVAIGVAVIPQVSLAQNVSDAITGIVQQRGCGQWAIPAQECMNKNQELGTNMLTAISECDVTASDPDTFARKFKNVTENVIPQLKKLSEECGVKLPDDIKRPDYLKELTWGFRKAHELWLSLRAEKPKPEAKAEEPCNPENPPYNCWYQGGLILRAKEADCVKAATQACKNPGSAKETTSYGWGPICQGIGEFKKITCTGKLIPKPTPVPAPTATPISGPQTCQYYYAGGTMNGPDADSKQRCCAYFQTKIGKCRLEPGAPINIYWANERISCHCPGGNSPSNPARSDSGGDR